MGSVVPDQGEGGFAWRPAVRTVGILAVVSALRPSHAYRVRDIRTVAELDLVVSNPEFMPSRSEYTLGWPNSPLLRHFSEATLTVDPPGVDFRRSSDLTVEALSWSMAVLVAGVVLIWVARTGRAVSRDSTNAEPGSAADGEGR